MENFGGRCSDNLQVFVCDMLNEEEYVNELLDAQIENWLSQITF